MIRRLTLATAALTMLAAPAVQASPRQTGEEKLAKLLEGRVAGEPKSCIFMPPTGNNLTVLDKTAIVYRDGDTVWVNRTKDPKHLDDDDVLIVRKFSGSQLCRLDQITTAERTTMMFNGVVFLDDFVPYRKQG